MKFKQLGKTKEKIPAIGMGTWKLPNDSESVRTLKSGMKFGMKFVDTAEMYGTEETVGEAIKNEEVFLATKVSPQHLRFNGMIKACDNSLKRLGIKTIDLYQIHWPNPIIPVSETMKAMEELVKQGKIRYIGVSNFSVNQTKAAQESLKNNEIVSIQVEYSPLVRGIEKDILPFCKKEKITVIAYSPFNRGHLFERLPEIKKILEVIGNKYDKTVAQVTLNWLVSKENVVAIPKAADVNHVKENAAAADFKIEKEDLETIDKTNSDISFRRLRMILGI
jgi:hypothetical protein